VLRRRAIVFLGLALVVLQAGVASADDGDPRFRRTTPRAALDAVDGALVVGIPGGRAWGIESDLRSLPPSGTTLIVRLGVSDVAVREAFVRVAYYGVATGRSRQLATSDSALVTAGQRLTVAVPIEPPDGAVSYRVRVLARLLDPAGRSANDAVTAVLRVAHGSARPFGSFFSRLLE
jgi:hypothetical protein